MYTMTIEPFNYALVFGSMLGVAILIMLERMASTAVTFMRGWKQ